MTSKSGWKVSRLKKIFLVFAFIYFSLPFAEASSSADEIAEEIAITVKRGGKVSDYNASRLLRASLDVLKRSHQKESDLDSVESGDSSSNDSSSSVSSMRSNISDSTADQFKNKMAKFCQSDRESKALEYFFASIQRLAEKSFATDAHALVNEAIGRLYSAY